MLYAGILGVILLGTMAELDIEKFGSWGWAVGMAIAAIWVSVKAASKGAKKVVARTSRRTQKNHEDITQVWKDMAKMQGDLLAMSTELNRALRERDSIKAAYDALKHENEQLRLQIIGYQDRISLLEAKVEVVSKAQAGI